MNAPQSPIVSIRGPSPRQAGRTRGFPRGTGAGAVARCSVPAPPSTPSTIAFEISIPSVRRRRRAPRARRGRRAGGCGRGIAPRLRSRSSDRSDPGCRESRTASARLTSCSVARRAVVEQRMRELSDRRGARIRGSQRRQQASASSPLSSVSGSDQRLAISWPTATDSNVGDARASASARDGLTSAIVGTAPVDRLGERSRRRSSRCRASTSVSAAGWAANAPDRIRRSEAHQPAGGARLSRIPANVLVVAASSGSSPDDQARTWRTRSTRRPERGTRAARRRRPSDGRCCCPSIEPLGWRSGVRRWRPECPGAERCVSSQPAVAIFRLVQVVITRMRAAHASLPSDGRDGRVVMDALVVLTSTTNRDTRSSSAADAAASTNDVLDERRCS